MNPRLADAAAGRRMRLIACGIGPAGKLRGGFAALLSCGVLAAGVAGCSEGADSTPQADVQRVQHGVTSDQYLRARELFIRHCAACHGVEGRGDGPAADLVFPRPRSFGASPLRFAATGAEIDEGLLAIHRSISKGVPRSSMVGFEGVLTEEEISSLSRYVHRLSLEQDDRRRDHSEGVAAPPRVTSSLIERGADLYRSMACHSCHGDTGRGDGPEAGALLDSIGWPILPGDLASGVYKSGQRPQDLYRVIVEGVPGTPMIAYGPTLFRTTPDGATNPRDVWALVAYIKSLAGHARSEGASAGTEFRLQAIADEVMFLDPSRVEWLRVSSERVTLRPLWHRPDVAGAIDIAFVRAGDRVGVLMHWADDSPDVQRKVDAFPDQVAVLFALGDEAPAVPMGIQIEEHEPTDPVNIWHWKASRQFDASFIGPDGPPADRNMTAGSHHLFTMDEDTIRKRERRSQRGAASYSTHVDRDLMRDDPEFHPASVASTVRSDPSMIAHGALEANAVGFGTLQYQPAEEQGVYSSAVWSNGRWFVTMFRDAALQGGQDVVFAPGSRIPIAFAVWDGKRGDRDSLKQISGWHWLVVDGSQ